MRENREGISSHSIKFLLVGSLLERSKEYHIRGLAKLAMKIRCLVSTLRLKAKDNTFSYTHRVYVNMIICIIYKLWNVLFHLGKDFLPYSLTVQSVIFLFCFVFICLLV